MRPNWLINKGLKNTSLILLTRMTSWLPNRKLFLTNFISLILRRNQQNPLLQIWRTKFHIFKKFKPKNKTIIINWLIQEWDRNLKEMNKSTNLNWLKGRIYYKKLLSLIGSNIMTKNRICLIAKNMNKYIKLEQTSLN
jgi:hypothetical protein